MCLGAKKQLSTFLVQTAALTGLIMNLYHLQSLGMQQLVKDPKHSLRLLTRRQYRNDPAWRVVTQLPEFIQMQGSKVLDSDQWDLFVRSAIFLATRVRYRALQVARY